jgi:hypothetical protein
MAYEIEETFPALGLSDQEWSCILNGFEVPPSEIREDLGEPVEAFLDEFRSSIEFLAGFSEASDLEQIIADMPKVLLLGVMEITDAYCIHLMDDGSIEPCGIADAFDWLGMTVPRMHSNHSRLHVETARRKLRDRYGDLDDVAPWVAPASRRSDAWRDGQAPADEAHHPDGR